MRTCTGCGRCLPEDSFPFKNRAADKRHARCHECKRAVTREHYQNNPQPYKERSKEAAYRNRAILRQKLWDYLLLHPCVDCGEADPMVLEFDHRDRTTKVATVSRLFRTAYSWERIMAEIDKCDVRCANCHRRRTADQLGWFSPLTKNDAG